MLVEDDVTLADTLALNLRNAGYQAYFESQDNARLNLDRLPRFCQQSLALQFGAVPDSDQVRLSGQHPHGDPGIAVDQRSDRVGQRPASRLSQSCHFLLDLGQLLFAVRLHSSAFGCGSPTGSARPGPQ